MNKIPNIKSFSEHGNSINEHVLVKQHEQYIAEAKGPSATEYESIITVGYNQGKPPYTLTKAKDKAAFANVSQFFPTHNTDALLLGKAMKTVTSGVMYQHGASKDGTSPLWKKMTGKGKDTPKTDMYTSKHNISLKKKGGSQLMSGAGRESIATLNAALEMSGEVGPSAILPVINSIEKDFQTLLLDGYLTDFKNKEKGFVNMSAKDYQDKSDEIMKVDAMHKSLTVKIESALQSEPGIRENICYIATTGYKKFPQGSRGIANKLIEFEPKSGTITHNFDTGTPTAMSSSMKNMASSTSFFCSFKTGGKGNPFSSLRTKTTKFESNEPNQTLNELIIETLMKDLKLDPQQLLSEGYEFLTEAGWISNLFNRGVATIKKAGKSIKNWLSNIASKILQGAKKAFKKIVKLGEKAFDALFEFLGVVIRNARIRISGVAGGFANK